MRRIRSIYLLMIKLIIFFPCFAFACLKDIKVREYNQKALPSLLNFGKNQYDSKIKVLQINCELYETVQVGDILKSKNEERSFNLRDGLFGSPIEETRFEVIEK